MTASTGKPALDAAEFEALYLRLRQLPSWGEADRRGALNHLTPERVRAASVEIRLGRTVSLAAPIETGLTPDDPAPAIHEMSGPPGSQANPVLTLTIPVREAAKPRSIQITSSDVAQAVTA